MLGILSGKSNNKDEGKSVKPQDTRKANPDKLFRETNNQINANNTYYQFNNGIIFPNIYRNNQISINSNTKMKSQKKEIKGKNNIPKVNSRINKSTINRKIDKNNQISETNNKKIHNQKSSVQYKDKKITDYYKP